MKTNSFITIFTAIIFLANCGSANTGEKPHAENSSPEKKAEPASNTTAQENDIIGEWEMVGSIVDTNDDLQIDEEERKNLKAPAYKDYMKLNRDGSGLFTIAKMEGRFEIKKDESNGRSNMTWYDRSDSPHRIGSIMKVTKNELTIKEPDGSGLFLWKRL